MTARIRTLIRRLRRDEDGSVLIMALIFVTVMGLVVGAMADLASVNMRNTVNTRDQREAVYTANSGVNAAIEAFRQNPDPDVCDQPLGINGLDDSDVLVTCIPTSGSSSGSPGSNQPPLALIALTADGAEPGFFADSGGQPYVVGGMYSNTTVSLSGSSTLTVEGPLVARNGCITDGTSSIVSDPAVTQCNIGTAAYANGADPLYTAAVSTVPTYRDVPSCPASGPVTMQPGTYNDGQALTDLFNDCAGRVFHFRPASGGSVGVFYFDFTNAGSHEWTINNSATTVVGGTFRSGVNTGNAQTTPVGQRCNAQADGVQFIFGGDSRINVQAGSVELCAQYDPTQTNQQIAIYGLDSRWPVAGTTSSPTYNAASTSGTEFANPDRARLIDGNEASATVSGATPSRTVTLNGFDLSGIPAGSQIHSVDLRVRHHESITTGQLSLSGELTGTGATFPCPSCLTKSATATTQTVSATSAFPTRDSLQNLSFSYTLTKSGGNAAATYTGFLDGVNVVVSYTPPALRRQAGCVATGPYTGPSPGRCAFITTSGAQTSLSIEGTVYAPLAAVDVQLTNVSGQVFGRGIIARVVRGQLTASSTCIPPTCSPFRLPTPTSTSGPTEVVFLATVEGNKRLRALVQFPGGGGAPTVRSWSSMNES